MLEKETAIKYYESLIFNHYESGGTCEQRVLVLRARFDRLLELLITKDSLSKDFYIEKLEQIFNKYSNRFGKQEKKECNSLRLYLNGVQHSTYEADEKEYVLSVKRLSNILKLCSDVAIPEKLSSIWNNKKNEEKEPNFQDNIDKDDHFQISVILCLDTSKLAVDTKKRQRINDELRNFITDITNNGLAIQLSIFLLEKNKVKLVKPFENNVTEKSLGANPKKCLNSIFEEITNCLEKREDDYKKNYWFIPILEQETLNMLNQNEKLQDMSSKNEITIIPIGLTKGMDLENFKLICKNKDAVVLQEGKESVFFNWLVDCFKITCSNN